MEAIYYKNIMRYCENRFANVIGTVFCDDNEFIVTEDTEGDIHFISCIVVDKFTEDAVTTKEQFEECFFEAVEHMCFSECRFKTDELQLRVTGNHGIIRLQLNCLGGSNV